LLGVDEVRRVGFFEPPVEQAGGEAALVLSDVGVLLLPPFARTGRRHRRGFAAAMAALIAEFNAYLDRDGADPAADSVSYRQGTLGSARTNSPR
jgi:hypothetical protein